MMLVAAAIVFTSVQLAVIVRGGWLRWIERKNHPRMGRLGMPKKNANE